MLLAPRRVIARRPLWVSVTRNPVVRRVNKVAAHTNNTPGTACTFPAATAWGNTVGTNTLGLSNSPGKASRTYNICGTVTAGQDVSVASYSDTVVATINF